MRFPFVAGMEGGRIVQIREDAEAHADFRKMMRVYASSLPEAEIEDTGFRRDVAELGERMLAEFKKIAASELAGIGREGVVDFALSAVSSVASGAWPKIAFDALKAGGKAGFKVATRGAARPARRTIYALLDRQ